MKFVRDFLWSMVLPVLLFCGLIYPGGTGLANVALFLGWASTLVPVLVFLFTSRKDWAKSKPSALPRWWIKAVRVFIVAVLAWAGCFGLAIAMIFGCLCLDAMRKVDASPATTT